MGKHGIQGRGKSSFMSDKEREDLFYEHVDRLHVHACYDYETLLLELMGSKVKKEENGESNFKSNVWESFEEAENVMTLDPATLQPSYDNKSYF